MGNLIFSIELILAQLLLISNYPKRKHFFIRLPIFIGLTVLICYFLPQPESVLADPVLGFLRFMTMLSIATLAMLLCFGGKPTAIISGCIAGYAVQHIAYQITTLLLLIEAFEGYSMLVESMTCLIVYIILFFTLGHFIRRHNYFENYDDRFIIISACIIFICIFIYRFARLSANDNITTICIAMYAMTCCILALTIQYGAYEFINLITSNRTLATLISQRKKQYEISKQNMELLNIKCHDLKHQLGMISGEEKEEIKRIIDIYDNPVQTGFDVLDIALNENLKTLHDKGIKINFTGDGKLLSFMRGSDIYSLFGNSIDNSIEALDKVDDENKKMINITLEEKGDLLVVGVSNYFSGELVKEHDKIVTSKKTEQGYHGFGLKSMEYICKKYQGFLRVKSDGEIFKVSFSFLRKSED